MTRVPRCTVCGTTEDVASYNLCGDCLHERAQRARADQGLPPTIEDRAALARIATILRSFPAQASVTSAAEVAS